MSEIPDYVWMGTGGLVAVVSFILGFLKDMQYNSFFKLMTFVGLGMVGYGYFKMKMSEKSPQQILEERRRQNAYKRGEMEVDIDMDDYRNNPHLRQQALQHTRNMQGYSYNGTPRLPPQGTNPSAQAYQQPHHSQAPVAHQPAHPQNYPQYQPAAQPAHHQSNHANPSQGPEYRYCSNCGSPLMKNMKYCPVCGARV